jgi:3-hydroxyisobutyrate dehydrogenase-like beta-hydroxyacid dehydrogenase
MRPARHRSIPNCHSRPEPCHKAQECCASRRTPPNAATAAAPYLTSGALYIDGNSCSPQTKCQAASRVEAAGGRFVDMAIMAPVHPRRHLTPVLLAGPHAEAASRVLASLGMRPDLAGDQVG